MLVLARKLGQTIKIGQDIKIQILEVRGGTVRIGLDAPRDVVILRGELEERAMEEAAHESEPLPMTNTMDV